MYLTNKFLPEIFFKTVDCFLNFVQRKSNKIGKVENILFSNIGHMGDVIISTAVIDLLKSNYPKVKIGFLSGSWTLPIVKNSKLIDYVHTFDHVLLNKEKSLIKRLRTHYKTAKESKKEITSIGYDVAIDLRQFFPNSIFLLHKSNIPHTTGFTSGGFGPLLNYKHTWVNKNQHLSIYHQELLCDIYPEMNKQLDLKTNLGFVFDIKEENSLLNKWNLVKNKYVVIHPGTGNPIRNWPISHWVELVTRIIEHGEQIVFTGKGYQNLNEIISIKKRIKSNQYTNLCDKLNYLEFCTIVQNSKYIVGVESFAGHLSGALDKSAVIIGSGTTNKYQWRPLGNSVKYITEDIACSPCYVGSGCGTMDCINLITPSVVYNEINKFVKQ